MDSIKETHIDKLLRKMRLQKVLSSIKEINNPRLLDIGCGFEARLLKEVEPYIAKGVGIDFKAPAIDSAKIKTFSYFFEEKNIAFEDKNITQITSHTKANQKPKHCHLPFDDESFEIVTMLAVIEHLNYPLDMLKEISRVLSKGGILLVTAPSHIAKPILEFLSYKLKIIDEAEIKDHKCYYDKSDFIATIAQIDTLELHSHKYFQCGMNNFCKIKKK